MTIGPVQAFVIGFPDNDLFEDRIVEELGRLSGQIRIIHAVFVMSERGDLGVLSVSDLDNDQWAELRATVGALVGLGIGGDKGASAGAELGASVDTGAPVPRNWSRRGLSTSCLMEARRSCSPSDTYGRYRCAMLSATPGCIVLPLAVRGGHSTLTTPDDQFDPLSRRHHDQFQVRGFGRVTTVDLDA
jgi:hypothetical protein